MSIPDWRSDQYIQFRPTDRVKDAGQQTVPFLDALPVGGKASPISGAGLYFKGLDGFGGYIAPVLIDYNAESFITNIDS